MSYRSTVVFYNLPDGGEVHLYDTFDPKVLRGEQREQRRINIRIPNHCDIDEELTGPFTLHISPNQDGAGD